MTSVQKEKELFVANELQSIIKKIDSTVTDVYYYPDIKKCEEYVFITFDNCNRRKICITADSLKSIVFDVLRAVE